MSQAAETQLDNTLIHRLGLQAREAASVLGAVPTEQIDQTLTDLSALILKNEASLLQANQKDVKAAEEKGLSAAMIDRLTLTPERLKGIAESVTSIRNLDDPVGIILEETTPPNGLNIQKISVPIGVLGMIYESRPNVTIDAAALCLKSHNAVILRGGSESIHSSKALHDLVVQAFKKNDLPESCVCFVDDPDRSHVGDMLAAHNLIDVMIPRGGAGLTSRVMREATMPVFAHLDGNCHLYVHHSADQDMAVEIVRNAKLRRTGICGAAESLLFDQNLPEDTARAIIQNLLEEGCTVVGDTKTQKLDERVQAATKEDWGTEYLESKISCKYVADVNEAITHINTYGSHHTDAIIAEDKQVVSAFLKNVDSAIVLHNASTQFGDGGEFGMGAEIGIGTGKLHARGPVGVRQLTTFKYLVHGNGQTRP